MEPFPADIEPYSTV